MIYGVIAGLIIIILVQLIYAHHLDERRREYADSLCNRWIAERDGWHIERQQLLDRIQAPTFAEYKHQEIKGIKAKNGTDKPDIVIEQL